MLIPYDWLVYVWLLLQRLYGMTPEDAAAFMARVLGWY